jgi:hypothetical protein
MTKYWKDVLDRDDEVEFVDCTVIQHSGRYKEYERLQSEFMQRIFSQLSIPRELFEGAPCPRSIIG